VRVTLLSDPTAEQAATIERARASYAERLRAREAALAQLERRDGNFSKARVACFVGFLSLVVAGWQLQLSWAWLLVPVLAFLILAMFHERVIERRDAARRAVAHYREGLDRLAGRWAGNGVTATDFCDAEHPYAMDLDLFGVGSLFDLLCRARTRAGEEQLARWLTQHADARVDASAISARQRSVQALRDELDLREDLAVFGAAARVAVRPAALIEWGRAPARLGAQSRARLAIAGVILPLLSMLGATAWGFGFGFGSPRAARHARAHRRAGRSVRRRAVGARGRARAHRGGLVRRPAPRRASGGARQ
jgi:hypothetical protein